MGAVDSLYRALEGDATPPGPRPVDPAGWVDRGALRVMEAVYLSGHSPDLGDVRGLVDDLTARYAAPEHLARPETLFGSTPPRPEPRVRRLGRVPGGERLGLTFPSPFQPRDPDLTPDSTSSEPTGPAARGCGGTGTARARRCWRSTAGAAATCGSRSGSWPRGPSIGSASTWPW